MPDPRRPIADPLRPHLTLVRRAQEQAQLEKTTAAIRHRDAMERDRDSEREAMLAYALITLMWIAGAAISGGLWWRLIVGAVFGAIAVDHGRRWRRRMRDLVNLTAAR